MSIKGSARLLRVDGLKVYFPIKSGLFGRTGGFVRAVDDVSFELAAGETLGIVGESGSGKTTIGRALLRAVPLTAGNVLFTLRDGTEKSVSHADRKTLKMLRRDMQPVFQDPFGSLNPRMTVFDIIADPLQVNKLAKGNDLESQVTEMLIRVGLSPAYMRRFPHAFSGGQRQRIGVARALIMRPRLVIADEPVSALDVSVQAQVLNLMQDLQSEFGHSYIFISHDLSVIKYIADRALVMYVGKIMEQGPTAKLFAQPTNPYTHALLSSVPVPDPEKRSQLKALPGEVADPANPPSGCYFHPRCPFVQEICRTTEPPLLPVGEDQHSRCHFAGELDLPGMLGNSAGKIEKTPINLERVQSGPLNQNQ